MKTIITNLLKNALGDLVTTTIGTIIGAPQMYDAIFKTHSFPEFLTGLGLFIGFCATNLSEKK